MKIAGTAFLAVLVISSVGIWGCAQQKCSAQTQKIRKLEADYAKMEEDSRTVAAASESMRKNLSRLELQRVELSQQVEDLKAVVQERDELRQKLSARTRERDTMHQQLAQFSKDLQNFAQRVDAVASAGCNGTVQGVPVSRQSN